MEKISGKLSIFTFYLCSTWEKGKQQRAVESYNMQCCQTCGFLRKPADFENFPHKSVDFLRILHFCGFFADI